MKLKEAAKVARAIARFTDSRNIQGIFQLLNKEFPKFMFYYSMEEKTWEVSIRKAKDFITSQDFENFDD